jgi:hypothetical protein
MWGLIPISKKQKYSTACLLPTWTDKDIGKSSSQDPHWSYGAYLQRLDKTLAYLNLDDHKIKNLNWMNTPSDIADLHS